MSSSLSTVYFVAIFVLDPTFLYWFIHPFAPSLGVEDQTQGLELVWQAFTLDCISGLSLCLACLLPHETLHSLKPVRSGICMGKCLVPTHITALWSSWCLLLSHRHTSHSV